MKTTSCLQRWTYYVHVLQQGRKCPVCQFMVVVDVLPCIRTTCILCETIFPQQYFYMYQLTSTFLLPK